MRRAPSFRARRRWRSAGLAGLLVLVVTTTPACFRQSETPDPIEQNLARPIPSPQAAILADGSVTYVELEQAVLGNLACLEAAGIPHSDVTKADREGVPHLEYVIGPLPDLAAAQPTIDHCHEQFDSLTMDIWALQHAPSEEERQEQQEAVLACLSDRGLEFADYSALGNEEEMSEEERFAFADCLLRVHTGAGLGATE